MYKFLPEQIEGLKKELESKTKNLNEINVIRKESFSEKKTSELSDPSLQVDNYLLESFISNTTSLNEIKNKLINCEVIEPNNSDEIGIGSTVSISLFFEGEEEKSIFTLVETHLSTDPTSFISIFSPLGRAVVNKKSGDNFRYVVENSIFSGKINEIIKAEDKVKTK